MKNSVSMPVLVIVAAGIVLSGFLIWSRLHNSNQQTQEPVAVAKATDNTPPPAAPVTSATPVPVAARQRSSEVPPVIPISLTNIIDGEEAAFYSGDAVMKALPRGTHVYGGIEFWLQGIVHLQGQRTKSDTKNFRLEALVPLNETNYVDGKVTVAERGKGIACIYIIAATRYGTESAEKFADIIWHYSDATVARSEIDYNVHLRDWRRTPYEEPAQLPNALTKVAWYGANPSRKATMRLYRVAFINPHPEKIIQSLEFASAMADPSLFVAALTLDPLPPGSRPDDLTSQEEADPPLNGQMQVYVEDSNGHSLADAQVTTTWHRKPYNMTDVKTTTDLNGMALVHFPDSGIETVAVRASHENYSDRRMLWDFSSGDTPPTSYTLKLDGEVKIGGIVVDTENNPVPGATVSLYRFWSGGDEMPDKKGEQPSFSTQQQKTDADGHWQAKGLPPKLLDHIGFNVKHPDFLTANANGVGNKQLHDGTYKTVLHRGLAVHGRVADTLGNPISGATIWAGRKYYPDRAQTKSDDEGQFSFHTVTTGDTLFSVMAKGFSPDNKTVNVQSNMDAVIFQLKPGNEIRAHVQDGSSQPVANARVGLEGSPGDPSYDAYEFTANTDGNGDFSWDSAPSQPMTFYIFHDGFESKRGVKLVPNQDNIITLQSNRQIQGVVIDANTEMAVTNFTVRTGEASADNSDVYGVIQYKSFTAPDGRFTMDVNEEKDNAIAMYATGYSDQIQRLPDAQNGIVQITIKLKPAAGISGIVLAPDGTPAPGVNVVATSSDNNNHHQYAQLTGGRLRSWDSHNKMTTTDGEGHFTISSPPDDGIVVAAGEQGFAQAPLADVRNNATVTLQAWGRIEGTLKIGGQPAAGKDLLFNTTISGIGTDFNGYKSTTDDQGQFTMENVPPGEGSIVRLIQTSPNSWTHSDSTQVMVKPGDTTQVTLGDNGAVVIGRIRFDSPPTNAEALSFEGSLSGAMPSMPRFNSPADAQAYFNSPDYKAMMKVHKNYAIELSPDGSFTTDDVVPGDYMLNVSARLKGEHPWEHPPVGNGSISVTVPDSFNPASPIDVGEVVVIPSAQR